MNQPDYKIRLAQGRQDRVMSLIQTLSVMPTAIHVPARIMQLYRTRNSPPLEKFAEVLIADAPLSAKVLELANSAWFAPPKPVTRVSDALSRIGLSNLLPLLFGLSLAGLFNKADLASDERTHLWQKSLLKGMIAREWAKWRGVGLEEEAFLCGILQDIAIPPMIAGDRSASLELTGVLDLAHEVRHDREAMLYGVDHAEFGRRVCVRLQLPELYVTATATHHLPEGPTLPDEYKALAGGLQLAASVPHTASRLDEHAARRMADCFKQVAPNTTPADFVNFIHRASESGKAITSALMPASQSKLGMKTFLQDVAEQIAKSLFDSVGTANQTIEQLQTVHVELEHKIHQLNEQVVRADYDSMTGVLNRGGLLHRGDKMIAMARSFEMTCAVGFLDLDDFKWINDHYGHDAGDRALIEFAAALRTIIQNRGMVSRCGGDEFVFILLMPGETTEDQVRAEVEASLSGLHIEIGNEKVPLKSSLGIAWLGVPEENQTIRDAMKVADRAMYQAKDAA